MPSRPRRRVLSQPSSGNRRVPCSAACDVEDGQGERQTGRIWNVSVAGVYLVIQPFAEVPGPLTLSFRLPSEAAPITVRGRVAWWNPPSTVRGVGTLAPQLPPGCGVEYLDLPLLYRRRIEAQVAQVSSNDTDPGEDS
ncbi:MAG TPA: PilZ domain-containing protein [Vicinamibacteria bacterium]|nr:PilZ domain-containing protein [Vicinamibacteria bacterium]